MSHYNELPFVVVNNNGVEVKLYDVDLDKYIINEGTKYNNVTYVSLDGGKVGRMKTRPYTQYTGIQQRTRAGSSVMKQRPTYWGCTLDEKFSTFDKWVGWSEKQVGYMCVDKENNMYHFDKDILSYPQSNKHYSPENCRFIPPKINTGINGFKNSKHLETKRAFLNMVFEDYFDTLDEDILGKIIEISGHEHGLYKFEVKTEEMMKVRNRYDVYLSKIVNWEETIDVSNFFFSDGKYSYKKVTLQQRYSTAKEAIVNRLEPRLEDLEITMKEYEEDKKQILGNWWRSEEFETKVSNKIVAYKQMISLVETGAIKLPHYVLTWV